MQVKRFLHTCFPCNIPVTLQLAGLAIFAIGIWIAVDPSIKDKLGGGEPLEYLHIGAYVIIAIGAFIALVGFLGCCGAMKESQCMLATVSATSCNHSIILKFETYRYFSPYYFYFIWVLVSWPSQFPNTLFYLYVGQENLIKIL